MKIAGFFIFTRIRMIARKVLISGVMVETEKYYDPDWRDRWFEKWNGVDVEGIIEQIDYGPADESTLARATFYQPIPVRYLARILRQARKSTPRLTHFIDVGCGKGKACVYMGLKGGFDRISGLEFAPRLVSAARANMRRAGLVQSDIIETDARDYALPAAPTLVFLFNPFDAAALDYFIQKNLFHFQKQRSLIAYAFDVRREVLRNAGFREIRRDTPTRLSFHQMP